MINNRFRHLGDNSKTVCADCIHNQMRRCRCICQSSYPKGLENGYKNGECIKTGESQHSRVQQENQQEEEHEPAGLDAFGTTPCVSWCRIGLSVISRYESIVVCFLVCVVFVQPFVLLGQVAKSGYFLPTFGKLGYF